MSTAPDSSSRPRGGPVDRPYEPVPSSALDGSIIDRFDLMAQRHPDRPAIEDPDGALTYAELAARADRIAGALHAAAADRLGPIAILLPNDARQTTAMIGALAAGCGFTPLDADHPPERNRAIAEQAGAAAVLSTGRIAGELRALFADRTPVVDFEAACQTEGRRPPVRQGPDDLAYILYTSGSTGAPKGVFHSHRNCLHDVRVLTDDAHLTCEDRIGQYYAGVIGAIRRTFAALLNGASLQILPPRELGAEGLVQEIRARRISIFHSVPTLFRRVMGAVPPGERLDSVRVVRLSGDRSEWSDYDLFRRACPEDAGFAVSLGSTEVSCDYARWFVDEGVRNPGARLPAGRPATDVRVAILGPDGHEVPDGEIGEFTASSRYLALGYWRAPELTAAAFAVDPDDPQVRLFKTGDMGLRRADGLLEFVGRKDQLIKLRGHRIEPAEVESALRRCAGVADAAIVIRRNESGVARAMVAYVEVQPGVAGLLPRHLLAMLSRTLPPYLLPSIVLITPVLPRLPNFKLDRTALARLDGERASDDASRASDPVLDEVAKAFETIVGASGATPEDNLLSLGGDSLQAVQVALELERRLGLKVPPAVMARSLCIRELADWISAALGERAVEPGVSARGVFTNGNVGRESPKPTPR